MLSTLDPDILANALARIERTSRRPGPPRGAAEILPIHTLVVPAQQFNPNTTSRAGRESLRLMQAFASDSVVLARALRLPGWDHLPTDPARVDDLLARLDAGDPSLRTRRPHAMLAHEVYRRVASRLGHEPVQDLRVDFHAGGARPDDEVDADASAVAHAFAAGIAQGTLPRQVGVRIGALRPRSAARALRTLDLVVSTLADQTDGHVPDGFLVSVPGVSAVDTVAALVQVLAHLEQRSGLRKGQLRIEIGIDRAETVLANDGRLRVQELVTAARGRCTVLHVDVEALASAAGPGVADSVRDLVRLSMASSAVQVSAGASPPMPLLGKRGVVTPSQQAEQFGAVHAAWASHATAVGAQLEAGTPWGWDLQPGQLPARWAATIAGLRQALPELLRELDRSLASALAHTEVDQDLIADGQARFEAVLRAVDCGAIDPDEVAPAGLDPIDLATRSFSDVVNRRRA